MYKSLDEIITENKSDHGLEGLIRILYRNVEERLLSIEEAALLASTTEEHFMELVEQFHEKKEDKDSKFPMLSAEVTRLKETEGGTRAVCEIMEHYENLAVKNANIEKIIRMLEKKYSKEEILDIGYTEDEFSEAEKQILQQQNKQ